MSFIAPQVKAVLESQKRTQALFASLPKRDPFDRLPIGAEALISLRRERKKPAEAVVVVDSAFWWDYHNKQGYALYADEGAYDFRCIYRLPVVVWMDTPDLGVIASIEQCNPLWLRVLTDEEKIAAYRDAIAILKGAA